MAVPRELPLEFQQLVQREPIGVAAMLADDGVYVEPRAFARYYSTMFLKRVNEANPPTRTELPPSSRSPALICPLGGKRASADTAE
jgi:hypothetical protein